MSKTKNETSRYDKPLKSGRHFLLRLPHKADIYEYLTGFCADNKIHCGTISIIGAVSKMTIGFYDQKSHQYHPKIFEQELEVVSCTGNVSLKDGKPFLHLHAVLSDTELRCWGGHVFPGSRVFAAEASIQELLGGEHLRSLDSATGLALWCPA